MAVLIDRETRVLVQGITGREGSFHTRGCLAYGTRIVAGVTPGREGREVEGVPVYHTVERALDHHPADASLVMVPAPFAADAVLEAAAAGIPLIVCITEGIPVLDMVEVVSFLRGRATRLVGPNCPGIIAPGRCKIGIMPGEIHRPGGVGVISRSGTLTYEAVRQISAAGLGQSTCVGIGGDPVVGTGFVELLELFARDPETRAVVLIGEIGGRAEEEAAAFLAAGFPKPVVAYVAGRAAPPGRRMGHAGAVIAGRGGTAQGKVRALAAAGAVVVENPAAIGRTVAEVLAGDGDRDGAQEV